VGQVQGRGGDGVNAKLAGQNGEVDGSTRGKDDEERGVVVEIKKNTAYRVPGCSNSRGRGIEEGGEIGTKEKVGKQEGTEKKGPDGRDTFDFFTTLRNARVTSKFRLRLPGGRERKRFRGIGQPPHQKGDAVNPHSGERAQCPFHSSSDRSGK